MVPLKCINEKESFLGDTKSERVPIEKDLGIFISHNLSCDYHADFIFSKAQRMLNLLYRTCKDITDFRTKKLLHIIWARSRVEYASLPTQNKFNAGPRGSFSARSILNTSASVN